MTECAHLRNITHYKDLKNTLLFLEGASFCRDTARMVTDKTFTCIMRLENKTLAKCAYFRIQVFHRSYRYVKVYLENNSFCRDTALLG